MPHYLGAKPVLFAKTSLDASATSIADVSTKNVIRFEDSTVRN